MEKVVLVGSGQHARVVLYNMKAQNKYEPACFIDADKNKVGMYIDGYCVEGTYDDMEKIKKKYCTNKFFIAFGSMKYRKKVFERFIAEGWKQLIFFIPTQLFHQKHELEKVY